MRHFSIAFLGVFLLFVVHRGLAAGIGAGTNSTERVVFETESGEIVVELYVLRAPGTVSNFLWYVDRGLYDGGQFHRTVTATNQPTNAVKIAVIQAGSDSRREPAGIHPIPLERTRDTGLSHTNGTISMARTDPDTATSDFFICIGRQPELDFGGKRNPDGQGFAAFGTVVQGMDVVRRIHQAPAEGQKLKPPVRLIKAHRVRAGEKP